MLGLYRLSATGRRIAARCSTAATRRGISPRSSANASSPRTTRGPTARTREFRDTYLVPHGIGAMLDIPLRQDNATVGVLCVEHVGRRARLDGRRAELRRLGGQSHRRGRGRRGAPRTRSARLAESEARARLIVDTAHDAFIGIDSIGRIVTWNAQAEHTFGWTRDEVVGRQLADTIIPPSASARRTSAGCSDFHATGEAPVVNQRLELTAPASVRP